MPALFLSFQFCAYARPWEYDSDACPREVGPAVQAPPRPVGPGDLAHNSQAQARPFHAYSRRTIEGLKDAGGIILRNAGSIIFHRERRRIGPDLQVDFRGSRAIAQGVVDKVAKQLFQQDGVNIDPDRRLGREQIDFDLLATCQGYPFSSADSHPLA